MICIFCNKEKEPSEEHIIPESIGGIVTIKTVCRGCNSKLGTEVDSELNRQRHIYNAYSEVKKQSDVGLQFHFSEAYFEDEKGNKIKVSKSNRSDKIIPTVTGEGSFTIDHSDTKFIKNKIKRIAKKQGIPGLITQKKISEYLYFNKFSQPDDIYVDEVFDIIIKPERKERIRKTYMSEKTPHRFLAKACVEFAQLLRIQDEIENLKTLRLHALNGDKLNEIECFEQFRNNTEAKPIHLIQFTPHQFHIHFFMKYATSIKIRWRNEALKVFLGNDILTKHLRILLPDEENNSLVMTEYIFNFRALH